MYQLKSQEAQNLRISENIPLGPLSCLSARSSTPAQRMFQGNTFNCKTLSFCVLICCLNVLPSYLPDMFL